MTVRQPHKERTEQDLEEGGTEGKRPKLTAEVKKECGERAALEGKGSQKVRKTSLF